MEKNCLGQGFRGARKENLAMLHTASKTEFFEMQRAEINRLGAREH
jgi:hypothetical protein